MDPSWRPDLGSEWRCVFQPRKTYRGRGLKPGIENLRGFVGVFRAMWKMDERDSYPSERAMEPLDREPFWMGGAGIVWVASGDLRPMELIEGGWSAGDAAFLRAQAKRKGKPGWKHMRPRG